MESIFSGEREKLFEEIEREWEAHLQNPTDDEVFDDIDECIVKVNNFSFRSNLGVYLTSIRQFAAVIFSDISERNNDYSDTLDFRRGRWGGHFFRFEGP